MARRVLAVVAGYITMFVLVLATFGATYKAIGVERAFQPGSYEPSMMWNLLSIALAFVAALWGGIVATKVGRSVAAAKMLAVVILVLGIAFAIQQITSEEDPGPRTGEVSNNDAMQKAKQPTWMALLNPVIGALGVMAGARRAAMSGASTVA